MFWATQPVSKPREPGPEGKSWTMYASDTPTVRARKLAEIAMADIFDNETKIAMLDRAAFRVAQALEKYAEQDAALQKPVTD